jgi:phage shock protein A
MNTEQKLNAIKKQHEQLERSIMEREVKIDNIITTAESLGVVVNEDMTINFEDAAQSLEQTIELMRKELDATVEKLEKLLNDTGVIDE